MFQPATVNSIFRKQISWKDRCLSSTGPTYASVRQAVTAVTRNDTSCSHTNNWAVLSGTGVACHTCNFSMRSVYRQMVKRPHRMSCCYRGFNIIALTAYRYWRLNYPVCCEYHNRDCQCFWIGRASLKIAPFPCGSGAHLIHNFWRSHESAPPPPNGISIDSAVLAGLKRDQRAQTSRPTTLFRL